MGAGERHGPGGAGHGKSFVFNLKHSGESSEDFQRRRKHDLKFIFKDHTSCSEKSRFERDKSGGRPATLDNNLELPEPSGTELPRGPPCLPQPRAPGQRKRVSTQRRGHE